MYYTLIAIAGFFGAYTFLLRGKVFCNAQTGNLVLLGLAIGQAEWETAAYYLFPISAYMAGAFISELLPNPVKYHLKIRWDTLLIAVEMATVLVLGLVPESAPVQISQVAVNLLLPCSTIRFVRQRERQWRQLLRQTISARSVWDWQKKSSIFGKKIKNIEKNGANIA